MSSNHPKRVNKNVIVLRAPPTCLHDLLQVIEMLTTDRHSLITMLSKDVNLIHESAGPSLEGHLAAGFGYHLLFCSHLSKPVAFQQSSVQKLLVASLHSLFVMLWGPEVQSNLPRPPAQLRIRHTTENTSIFEPCSSAAKVRKRKKSTREALYTTGRENEPDKNKTKTQSSVPKQLSIPDQCVSFLLAPRVPKCSPKVPKWKHSPTQMTALGCQRYPWLNREVIDIKGSFINNA